jgi:spore coat polysaccharide biosynthesis protein SpsF
MNSTRLPGKVLLDIAGQPMLSRVVERARRAKTLDQVVVATTVDPSDDPVETLCKRCDYPCYRGSASDVLDRYYQTARQFKADVIVRLTADCPLIDPQVIDATVSAFYGLDPQADWVFENLGSKPPRYDFAANRLPPPWTRTYPIGLDTEVCSFQALERAWQEATELHQREHVMPYLYEQTGRFRVCVIHHDPDYGALRFTVDTAEDLQLVREIYKQFGGREDFSWMEVVALIARQPELAAINASVAHKTVHDVDVRR